ncbi:MAG: toll/interleukin-1 receptor domain-containing protein [Bifidobacterium sp.]|uniref:Toll/interleukin-1 receptor domain-containing protein n=1 Tax=Bifidobacterium fermentum TaxID=3059035 RepID=A0AB39UBQ8_9BIFI
MSIDIEKLSKMRSVARTLAECDFDEVNLLFHELHTDEVMQGQWEDEDGYERSNEERFSAVLNIIRDLPRDIVEELVPAVSQLFETTIQMNRQQGVRPLFLFASHLTSQKALVGQVSSYLKSWGIMLFVAHESIVPDHEWLKEIEKALHDCDAGVAFLSPHFNESKWCDQEVGWLLGREVPCYALKFHDEDPYGPFGKKQAFPVRADMTAEKIGDEIIRWLSTKPELTNGFYASMVEALKLSQNYHRTDLVWKQLYSATGLDSHEVASILAAIRDNDQVYNASGGVGGENGEYKELAFKLALKQPGFETNRDLAKEVAKSRGLESLLPVESTSDVSDDADPWAVDF